MESFENRNANVHLRKCERKRKNFAIVAMWNSKVE